MLYPLAMYSVHNENTFSYSYQDEIRRNIHNCLNSSNSSSNYVDSQK